MRGAENRRGSACVSSCVAVLAAAAVLSAVLFYAEAMSAAGRARAGMRRALDGFVTENGIEIYRSVRDGHDFTEAFDGSAFAARVAGELGLVRSGDLLCAEDGEGRRVYSLTVPRVSFARANALRLRAECRMMMPVKFAGGKLPDIVIPLSVSGALVGKER